MPRSRPGQGGWESRGSRRKGREAREGRRQVRGPPAAGGRKPLELSGAWESGDNRGIPRGRASGAQPPLSRAAHALRGRAARRQIERVDAGRDKLRGIINFTAPQFPGGSATVRGPRRAAKSRVGPPRGPRLTARGPGAGAAAARNIQSVMRPRHRFTIGILSEPLLAALFALFPLLQFFSSLLLFIRACLRRLLLLTFLHPAAPVLAFSGSRALFSPLGPARPIHCCGNFRAPRSRTPRGPRPPATESAHFLPAAGPSQLPRDPSPGPPPTFLLDFNKKI